MKELYLFLVLLSCSKIVIGQQQSYWPVSNSNHEIGLTYNSYEKFNQSNVDEGMHNGIDIKGNYQTDYIVAVQDGYIAEIKAQENGASENVLFRFSAANTGAVIYGHVDASNLYVGQSFSAGDNIAPLANHGVARCIYIN